MTACFADTFYFLALLNPHDDDHDIAVRVTRTLRRPLVTTSLVLVELADGLAGTRSRQLFGPFYRRMIRDSKLTVVPCDDAMLERGVQLYDQRLDKGWSLTDCISFVVMKRGSLTRLRVTTISNKRDFGHCSRLRTDLASDPYNQNQGGETSRCASSWFANGAIPLVRASDCR
jgi:predicted nucleic acid-binding protein